MVKLKRNNNKINSPVNTELLEKEIAQARNSLTTDRLDMSFGEIMAMYQRGELIISPEFQRLYRWDINKKTKFLESIILGIPIPPIFVAEDNNGCWELVDGLQRLSTIFSFFGILNSQEKDINNWEMASGDLLDSLDGYSASTLPMRYILNIKRSVCRIEIIKWDSKWDMRYELFSRLNTGGEILTDQEIRNSIFRSGLRNFYSFIDKAINEANFKSITKLTQKQKLELFDQELIVRYVSLVDSWEQVDLPISTYATEYMRKMLVEKRDINPLTISRFYDVIDVLKILGKDTFRIKSTFSPSAYDAIMVATTHFLTYFQKHPEQIKEAVEKVKSSSEFKETRSSAGSKTRTKKKIEIAMKIFESIAR